MVSGNAMAHLYFDLDRRERPFWPVLAPRWAEIVDALLGRPAVDLVMLPLAPDVVEVRAAHRGRARIAVRRGRYDYQPLDGDPLGTGVLLGVSAREAYDATVDGPYPDAIVQIAQLAGAERSGDVMLSAAPGWDFRERHEPIPHRSAHGALLRDHMLAPLLVNHPVAQLPRRTVDVMPSALAALGRPVPPGVDGECFVAEAASLALSPLG